VASQITRDWANASSRVTRPSRRPSIPADAPLEVASAPKENQKIACGRKHFDTLGVDYDVVTSLAEVKF
jgi:hypothetical protein